MEHYNSGKFVHKAIGGGGVLNPDFYGESAILLEYFNGFAHDYEVIHVTESMQYEPNQMLVIFRKK